MEQEHVRHPPLKSSGNGCDVVGALAQQQQFSAVLPGSQRLSPDLLGAAHQFQSLGRTSVADNPST